MNGFVLMDGSHEPQLQKYVGSGFDGHPLWVSRYLFDSPDDYRRVHQDFIQNGCDIILTGTYQATVDGFRQHYGFSKEESLAIIRRSVTLCKEAIDLEKAKGNARTVRVVGVIGPYGAYLHDGSEYSGGHYADQMALTELAEWHRSRVEALIEAGADYLIFATIPSAKEAEALISLLKEHPGIKAILSFSAQNEETISHGEKLSDVAEHCWELAADNLLAIGVNCQHPRLVEPLLRSIKQMNPDIPLFLKPNNNEIFNTTTGRWEEAYNTKSLREYCKDWLNLGVKYIGGCCRTTMEHIKDFRQEIDSFQKQ